VTEATSCSAAEIAESVRRGTLSAEAVAKAHLDRISAHDGKLRAFLHVDPEGALSRARAIDAKPVSGRARLALAGVPFAIKDSLHVLGMPTTCGSRILEAYRPPFAATAVTRLLDAGAVILGKTNLDEFCMGSSTENSAFGPTLNPWDPSRVPGGSSGGSAAAVATGMACAALGSDTGGSIRQPAAFCGISGLKPTYGRVSRRGLVAFASSLDQVGPLARTVGDLALVLSIILGVDPLDATSVESPPPDVQAVSARGVEGLSVGVPWAFLESGIEPGTLAAFREAVKALEAEGVRMIDVALPHLPHAIAAYYLVATAEASSNLARYDGVRYGLREPGGRALREMYGRTRDRGFGAEVKRRILLGTFVLSAGYYEAYYVKAQQVRSLIRGDFERALQVCDAIATPTTPTPAFGLGEKTADPLQMYLADVFTVPANLAGLPGLSVPCGLSCGLPVGLQLVGRALDELTLLRLGRALEQAAGWHAVRPLL
jgi:aspartyl-tRNA(Asn)/glutamyl-tRNA(Gln) amidotransferase subunit A